MQTCPICGLPFECGSCGRCDGIRARKLPPSKTPTAEIAAVGPEDFPGEDFPTFTSPQEPPQATKARDTDRETEHPEVAGLREQLQAAQAEGERLRQELDSARADAERLRAAVSSSREEAHSLSRALDQALRVSDDIGAKRLDAARKIEILQRHDASITAQGYRLASMLEHVARASLIDWPARSREDLKTEAVHLSAEDVDAIIRAIEQWHKTKRRHVQEIDDGFSDGQA